MPFSDGEFFKDCMAQTTSLLCPESKDTFEKIRLSRRTVIRRVKLTDEDIASKLSKQVD